MQPTRKEIREIIADMPNWETLEHLFAYVIGHWEQIKRRKATEQVKFYAELEEKLRDKEQEFYCKCVEPYLNERNKIAKIDHLHAPVKCKKMYVGNKRVK